MAAFCNHIPPTIRIANRPTAATNVTIGFDSSFVTTSRYEAKE